MTDLDGTAAALHLFSPEVADAPHEAYRQLREQCPVAKGDLGGHHVVLHLAVRGRALGAAAPGGVHARQSGLDLGEQPLLPARGRPARPHRLPAHPQPAVRAPRDREAGARHPRSGSASCSTASPTAASCDFHEEFADAAAVEHLPGAHGPARPRTCPKFLQWRDNTIRPDVAPGDIEGAARIRTGDRPRHLRLLPRAHRRAPGRARTTRCCRRSSTPPSTAVRSTRPSCSASATCSCSAGSTPSPPPSTAWSSTSPPTRSSGSGWSRTRAASRPPSRSCCAGSPR